MAYTKLGLFVIYSVFKIVCCHLLDYECLLLHISVRQTKIRDFE